jgi:hypothetical protein
MVSTHQGIDLHTGDGESVHYVRYKQNHSQNAGLNFLGVVMRMKRDQWDENGAERVIERWEVITGLDFNIKFPPGTVVRGSACTECYEKRETCDKEGLVEVAMLEASHAESRTENLKSGTGRKT